MPPKPRETPPALQPVVGYFERRVDPLTNVFLVLPLFAIYHVGLLAQLRRGPDGNYQWIGNGADFLTGTLLSVVHGNVWAYAGFAGAVTVALAVLILVARRRSKLHPKLFVPVLLESTLYAYLVAAGVGLAVRTAGLGILDHEGLVAQVIASCGAGLHEELVFRMGIFGVLAWLFSKAFSRPAAWVLAIAISATLFSAMHYLPPLGDTFTVQSFAFRAFCGVAFALIFQLRGFAIAAWTHALYDIFYFLLRPH